MLALVAAMSAADNKRVRKAEKATSAESKMQRKKRKQKKARKEDAAVEREGPTYEAGAFGPDGNLLDIPLRDATNAAKKPRKCRKCGNALKGEKRHCTVH